MVTLFIQSFIQSVFSALLLVLFSIFATDTLISNNDVISEISVSVTTIEFVFKGTKGTAGTKIKSFLDYLANGGYFKMYCEWCKHGLQNVRYVSYDPNAEYIDNEDSDPESSIITFKVKLAVDDPETSIILLKE